MTSSLFDATDLHVLITGAGSGIGLMIAQAYYNHGAIVYLVGRRAEKLQEAQATISKSSSNGKIVILPGDVSTREGIEKLVSDFEKHSPSLDILVSNAGIYKKEAIPYKPIYTAEEMKAHFLSSSVEDFTETTAVNVAAAWHLSGAFIPHLQKAKAGNIIMISSINGVHWSASSSNPSYAASKVAVNHLTKIMANRLAPLYIRVNTIAPGMFPSEMNNSDTVKAYVANGTIAKIPAKRLGSADEMGSAALFLGTNSYVDGEVLVLDGGRSLVASGS